MDQAKLNQLKAKVNNIEELKASEIYDAVYSVEDVDPYTILGLLKEVLALIEKDGTNVYYGEKYQENVYFLRDPQAQITELVNLTNELGIEDTRLDALIDALDSTKADVTSIKNVWKYAFNQLFNPASSTLPSANGLTVTNIYGGHHVSGTTDSQYYHKMYNLDTKIGHWYYFTPNFSNKQNVYILGHIDSTSFSTKSGKVFQAGNKFDIYIQIERDNTLDFNVLPILVDLTEMFGSGNEPTTLEGVYEYINPDTYYPYQDKLTDNQIQAIGEIDAIKGIALDNQSAIETKQDKIELVWEGALKLNGSIEIQELKNYKQLIIFAELGAYHHCSLIYDNNFGTSHYQGTTGLSEDPPALYGLSIFIENTTIRLDHIGYSSGNTWNDSTNYKIYKILGIK